MKKKKITNAERRVKLKESRTRREEIIKKYVKVFTSVWKIDYRKNKLMFDPRGRKEDLNKKKVDEQNLHSINTESAGAYDVRGRNVRGKEHADGHSVLPYDLMENLLKFYTEKNDLVLDPTMGDMAVQTVTFHLERNFIGYDVSEKNFRINEEVRKRLTNETLLTAKQLPSAQLNFQSSTKLNEKDNSIDFIFFSPPYWDLEYYGEEKEQLGFARTYEDFLNGLALIIQECFRVLKPGKFITININDFRKDKKFYAYHVDVHNLLKKVGFKIHDIIIVDWNSCIGQCFASQIEDRKMTAKQHEYIWVATKEDTKQKDKIADERSERKKKKEKKVKKEKVNKESKSQITKKLLEKLNKEEVIEIEEKKEPEIVFPEGQILMVLDEFENLISREKAIELLKERGGKHE